MAEAEGVHVVATRAASETEVLGVNSPSQLADLERRYQRGLAEALMDAGVRHRRPGALRRARRAELRQRCRQST
jgi:bifunctional UDP-N-acetylglucosamine pyrophosphorylase/glucosamine-1-phosphate N-acetyltransferase